MVRSGSRMSSGRHDARRRRDRNRAGAAKTRHTQRGCPGQGLPRCLPSAVVAGRCGPRLPAGGRSAHQAKFLTNDLLTKTADRAVRQSDRIPVRLVGVRADRACELRLEVGAITVGKQRVVLNKCPRAPEGLRSRIDQLGRNASRHDDAISLEFSARLTPTKAADHHAMRMLALCKPRIRHTR
jgi:hypothetical protein